MSLFHFAPADRPLQARLCSASLGLLQEFILRLLRRQRINSFRLAFAPLNSPAGVLSTGDSGIARPARHVRSRSLPEIDPPFPAARTSLSGGGSISSSPLPRGRPLPTFAFVPLRSRFFFPASFVAEEKEPSAALRSSAPPTKPHNGAD